MKNALKERMAVDSEFLLHNHPLRMDIRNEKNIPCNQP